MSRAVISILPSCMSFGWTKRMSSSISSSFSRAAQTSPSKSLRVTRRYFSLGGLLPSLITRSQSAGPAPNLSPALADATVRRNEREDRDHAVGRVWLTKGDGRGARSQPPHAPALGLGLPLP